MNLHFYAISLIIGCQEWLFEMIIIATWTFSCVIFAENIGIHDHMVGHPCCVFINYIGLINC